jgi:hypothetical protein
VDKLSADELANRLVPLNQRLRELADMYEKDGFGTRTLSDLDKEIAEVYEMMIPIHAEIARRHPEYPYAQQSYRDFKLLGSQLRGRTRPY